MNITQDVIIDLMPIYEAGESSADTQALVETYLQQNPDFAKLIEAGPQPMEPLYSVDLNAAQEMKTLKRVNQTLRTRSILLGLALFCSLMPFSIAGNSDEGITWTLIQDMPVVAIMFGVAAVAFWIAYSATFRQVRVE